MVAAAHLCDYNECFKWVNFIGCELYLNKAVKAMTFDLLKQQNNFRVKT